MPPVPEDLVPRQRLNTLLNRIPHRPLTLVSAPAGYGKSTSVAAWLVECDLHRAWLSLDEADNDPALFMIYVLAAIRRAVPSFGVELGAALEASRIIIGAKFAESIFSELDRLGEDVVLVIEDGHLIRNDEVLGVLRELMRHPHPRLHLVVISRHDVPLPLSDWRARNLIVEVRATDLRFSLEETARFLHHSLGDAVDEQVISLLHQNTEGWAAGLRLALLSLTFAENVDKQALQLTANNRLVVEYLAEQVLDGLPADRQRFLIETSILDRLCATLCEAVVQAGVPTDGQAILTDLKRENVFMIPLDGEMRWFRCHHLLLQFLRGQLARHYTPEDIAALHLRAGRWFAAAGLTEEAIRHTISAGELDEAVGYLASRRHDLFNHEQWQRLMSWFTMFPERVVNKSPDLLLIKAWFVHAARFEIDEIASITDQVEALLRNPDLDPDRARLLQAENGIFRGITHYYQLEASACIERCRDSLDTLPVDYYTLRSYGWIYTAGALLLLGDLPGVFDTIRLARREDLHFPDHPRGRNAGAEGYVCWMLGDLPGVERIGRLLLSTAATGTQYNSLSWGHYFLACAHYHWNNLAEAQYHAQQVFDNRFANHAIANLYSGFILTLVHQARGHPEEAADTLAQVSDFATTIRSQSLVLLAQAMQAELNILQGRPRDAVTWARRILPALRPIAMPMFYSAHLTVPKVLLAAGDAADAALLPDIFNRIRGNLESTHNTRFLCELLALEAMYHGARGDSRAAFAALERSLTLARQAGFIRLFVDLGPNLRDLLVHLPQKKDLASYIARILTAFPKTKTAEANVLVDPLTDRELEILTLLAQRFSNKEIATELVISPMTVKRHTINIYQKLYVQNRREAVEAAQRLGIIE